MRIAVIGCGYLGAVHAACMTKIGHDVTGLDTDQEKAERLARGEAPFHEPGFPELLAQGVASGRLTFTTDPERIAGAELVFIGVGTPQLPGRLGADLSQVDAAVDTIIRYVVPRPGSAALVAGKSTVPVGTAQRVAEQLAGSGRDLLLAWNPEFLREGHAVTDTLRPDRIVYGLPRDRATGERAKALLDECYAPMLAAGTPLVVADYPTAELVKVAANAFLATKISFINAMAELCDATGGDVTRLAEAIGHDDRIGPKKVIIVSLSAMVLAGFGVFALHSRGAIVFWTLGLVLCIFVGPTQSASRSFLSRIIPEGREGEVFGLYATTGRAVSFLAPAMYWVSLAIGSAITPAGQDHTYWGILGIMLILLVGLALTIPVKADRATLDHME